MRSSPLAVARTRAPLIALTFVTGVALAYALRFARSAPASDEWLFFPGLVDFSWEWVAKPLNEHWLPVSKLLYTAVVRVAHLDVRAAVALIVVLLAIGAWTVSRELVQSGATGAASLVPFVVFHPVQYETLLSGVNLHFALCALLLLTATVVAARGRAGGPSWALITVTLAITGATGLLYALPLSLALLAPRDRRPTSWIWRSLPLAAIAGMLIWYGFYFRHQPGVPRYSTGPMWRGALEALGSVLLPFAKTPSAGVIVAGALLAVAMVLPFQWRQRRPGAPELALCLAAVLAEALGIGYGRGMYGAGMSSLSRYTTLILPAVAIGLLIAARQQNRLIRRALFTLLLIPVFLSWPQAAVTAWHAGVQQHERWQEFERDVRLGASFEQLVGRHADTIYDDDVRDMEPRLMAMHDHRMGPFRTVPGDFTHTAELNQFHLLSLPSEGGAIRLGAPHRVRAIRVRFRLRSPQELSWVRLRWTSIEPSFARPHAAAVWVEGDGRELQQVFWIWDTIDDVLLDVLASGGPRLDVSAVECFDDAVTDLQDRR